MDMSHLGVLILVGQDHLIKQCIQTLAVARNNGHHRHTNHTSQLLIIQMCTAALQLIVHIQRNDHLGIKVDKLGCKEEVALKIRCHHSVDHNVGHLIHQVTANIQLLGGICRQSICSGQVGDIDFIALIMARSALGIDRNTAIVTYVLVLTREGIEKRSLATIGVTHQSNVYLANLLIYNLLYIILIGRCSHILTETHSARLIECQHLDHSRLATAQRDLVTHQAVFDRVAQRGIEHRFHSLSSHKTHLEYSSSESAVSQHFKDNGRFACLQIRQKHILTIFASKNSDFLRHFPIPTFSESHEEFP